MNFRRILLAALALAAASAAFAASVADRSPFAQGLWWNPAKSGHGFQVFNAADQAMVVWYTYDAAGNPTWYTSQGDTASAGSLWPLMQHRWVNGRKADPTVVGTLRLNVRHPEGIDLDWEIGARQGTWAIQPFTVSGVVNEVDHTGLWYDLANSGWGFTLLEQGNVLGGILFGYDVSGAPTWAAGFDRTPGRVDVWSYTGPCPWCDYRTPTTSKLGQLTFDFRSETEMVLGTSFTPSMAAGTNINGARVIPLTRPASSRAADRQLANFPAAAALKTYLDAGMLSIPLASGGVDFSAAPPAATYSPTNLIESGVDEADLVKTNGRRVYAFRPSFGLGDPAIRVLNVSNEGAGVTDLGTVALAAGTRNASAGLYLDGDTLAAVTSTSISTYAASPWASVSSWTQGSTRVQVFGGAGGTPYSRWLVDIDGHYISSRRIGQRLYVVTRYVPYLQGFYFGTTYAPSVAENRRLLAAASLPDLLPKLRFGGGSVIPAVGIAEVFAPPQGSRPLTADMALVTAIDLAGEPRIAQTLAIVGGAEAIYASTENLFVASSRNVLRNGAGALLPVEPYFTLTDIHQVRLGANLSIVGSASVEGFLAADVDKAALRMSEHQGRLRVVTSSGSMWGGAQKNRLTILEPSTRVAGLLRTVSWLPNDARPQSLGKPGELLYSTRFVGDRLYAVTFKKVDPLYVVNLSDVADPRIAGELELPGFSDYLHPLPNGLLLGFGKDARPASSWGDGDFAWYQGLQLTLFDVSNDGRPRELQRMLFGKRGSDSALLRDHHAFSIRPTLDGSMELAFPARLNDGVPIYGSGDSTFYPWQQSGLMRVELRGTDASNAQLVQSMPHLITHAANAPPPYAGDAASNGARSILFENGALYYGADKFWYQDRAGAVFGPF